MNRRIMVGDGSRQARSDAPVPDDSGRDDSRDLYSNMTAVRFIKGMTEEDLDDLILTYNDDEVDNDDTLVASEPPIVLDHEGEPHEPFLLIDSITGAPRTVCSMCHLDMGEAVEHDLVAQAA